MDRDENKEMSHSQILAKYQHGVTSFGHVHDEMDLDVDTNVNTGGESKASLFDNTNFSESQTKPNSLLNESNSEDEKKYFQNLNEEGWNVNKRNNKNHNKYAMFEYPDD